MMLFEMFRGDTEILSIAIVNRQGDSVDLTGASAACVVRLPTAPYTALVTKTTADTITVSGSSLLVPLEPGDTDDLAPGLYLVEAEVRDYLGNVSTVVKGEMYIKREVIR
jgi:hypothetical protein